MSELVEKAEKFGLRAHDGTIRPNRAREPYSVHISQVARLIEQAGGSEEEIAAGWLHDTVEDTNVTIEMIRAKFGDKVAELVAGLTDPEWPAGISTLERKRL